MKTCEEEEGMIEKYRREFSQVSIGDFFLKVRYEF